jgi:hypothetical protein
MQLRVKQDPKLFAQFWRAQIANRQLVECARMLESCVLAQKEHRRVPIKEISGRTGMTIPELARLLTDVGAISPGKVIAACPDSDSDKSMLVAEMMISHNEGISTPRCEDRHPFVLSLSFINEVAHSTRRYDARTKTFVANV